MTTDQQLRILIVLTLIITATVIPVSVFWFLAALCLNVVILWVGYLVIKDTCRERRADKLSEKEEKNSRRIM